MNIRNYIQKYLNKIRKQTPIIHNITNFVVMNSSANILLALGASPVMAHCIDEVEEMISISNSLVLNIGTLDKNFIESMIKAAKIATISKTPIILDIVGAGATKFRTNTVHTIMEKCQISVLRGNASELLAITSENNKSKGVDSAISISENIVETAKKIALTKNCVVAISGTRDIITDGVSITRVDNGHPIMTKITGMGCGLTASTGAFCAVSDDDYSATISAFAHYGVCGDIAAKSYGNKPGSFFVNFLDTIYATTPKDISKLIKVKTE